MGPAMPARLNSMASSGHATGNHRPPPLPTPQPARATDGPVPVSVCLDDDHHVYVRANALTYRLKVCGERVQIDLRPRRSLPGQIHSIYSIAHLYPELKPLEGR